MDELFVAATQKLLDGAFSVACDVLAARVGEAPKRLRDAHAEGQASRPDTMPRLVVPAELVHQSIADHLAQCKTWSSTVTFSDLTRPKELQKIHVELDTYVVPARLQISAAEAAQKRALKDVVRGSKSHVVVLGAPGAGKTTSVKRFCAEYFEGRTPILGQSFPIYFRLRDPEVHAQETPLLSAISRILPVSVDWEGVDYLNTLQCKQISDRVFLAYVDHFSPFIVFDGLDEVPDAKQREKIIDEFRSLATQLRRAKLILTCRTGELRQTFDNVSTFEIAPLSQDQVKEFAARWLPTKADSDKFCQAAFASPLADTIKRPLIVAHLCAIYERVGSIPEKPRTIYRKIIYLLLEDWDQQRGVIRRSKYAFFEIDRKTEFLAALAYRLSTHYAKSTFSRKDMSMACGDIARGFKLSISEVDFAATEIESHTGIVVEAGFDSFEFSHKSIQEYLTAEYIVRSATFTLLRRHLERLPTELAIAVSISADSTQYLSALVLTFLHAARPSTTFLQKFLTRLAQESPDIYSCKEAALTVVALASMGADIADLRILARDCLGVSGTRWILETYSAGEEANGDIALYLRSEHESLDLPQKLEVPGAVARLLPLELLSKDKRPLA